MAVDGWFEWRPVRGGKQPFYFFRQDGEPIFFGGLWAGETFCLLTTEADGHLTEIHDRRPLALRDDFAEEWAEVAVASAAETVRHSIPPAEIAFHPVSKRVSSARNDGPDLIVRVENDPVQSGQEAQLDLFQNPA